MRRRLVGPATMILGAAFLFLFFFLILVGLLAHGAVVRVGLGVATHLAS